jgi:hypothetical protein
MQDEEILQNIESGVYSLVYTWMNEWMNEWMNDNNIYSENQHHKNCFSDGSCKTLKYKV